MIAWHKIWDSLIQITWLASSIIIRIKWKWRDSNRASFAGATKLLRSGLIENIWMEVKSGQNDTIVTMRIMLTLIVDAGYYLHDVGGPDGPNWETSSNSNR